MKKLVCGGQTKGTETSKYLEEKKSTEISSVAASESESGQTGMLAYRGCRTCIKERRQKKYLGKYAKEGEGPVFESGVTRQVS